MPVIGKDQSGKQVRLNIPNLVETRMLVQANSGGGKSYALRKILETSHGQVQQIVIDPEGEFNTLREKFDYIIAAPKDGDAVASPRTAKVLARKLLETGVSAIVDIYDMRAHERRDFVETFCNALVNAPKRLWHPVLVVLDEAHVFAPQQGKPESLGAVIDLATRGRKRGYSLIAATQRLSKLHKDVAAELLNKMIGRTGMDVDVKRAVDEMGFVGREGQTNLRRLSAGEWFGFGPAISMEVVQFKVGPVVTTHPKVGNRLLKAPPAPSSKIRKILADLDVEKEVEQEATALQNAQRSQQDALREVRELRRELKSEQSAKPKPVSEEAIATIRNAVTTDTIKRMDNYYSPLLTAMQKIRIAVEGFELGVKPAAADIPPPPRPVKHYDTPAPPLNAAPISVDPAFLGTPQVRILKALAICESFGIDEPARATVGAFAKYRSGAGHFTNILSGMKTAGLIVYPKPGCIALTKEGQNLAEYPDKTPTLKDLHNAWMSILPGEPYRKILKEVISHHPDKLSREELGARTGYSPRAGHFTNMLSKMKTLGAITYPSSGVVAASEYVFPHAG